MFLCLFLGFVARGQMGFVLPNGSKQVDIPFEYVNNFIVLDIMFNGPMPLRFIYDTGAEHTILTKREISDLLQVQYDREFRVKGSDMKSDLVAYLARNIRLQLVGREIVAPKEDLLVLQEDYFRFEEYAGLEIHGILAGRVFSRYLVKINYQRHVISLYDRSFFSPKDEGFLPVPAEIFRNKLYLVTQAQLRADSSATVKLLLDTGAGLPLMLFTNTHPLIAPPPNAIPNNIGMGLGGYLEGFVGRTPSLSIVGQPQRNVLTYYQTIDTTQDLSHLNGRNGLLGNMILSRFQIVVDYQGAAVWLKPVKNYQSEYVFDRSGLNIIASGTKLSYFTVLNVLPNSPADEAGILAGDRVMRIGLFPASMMSLAELQKKLQKKSGKKIRVVIKRNGKISRKWVVLRELI
jgi:Periplasmic protease